MAQLTKGIFAHHLHGLPALTRVLRAGMAVRDSSRQMEPNAASPHQRRQIKHRPMHTCPRIPTIRDGDNTGQAGAHAANQIRFD